MWRGIKTQKKSEIFVLLHPRSQRFFVNVSLKFLNINNRRVKSTFVFYATDLGVSVGYKKILIIPDP